jgi:hypothetical protein
MSACALVTLAVAMLQIDAVAAGIDPDPEIAPSIDQRMPVSLRTRGSRMASASPPIPASRTTPADPS